MSDIKLPIHTITLAAGVVTTSYTFFTALGESQRGIIPLVNNKLGPIDLSPASRARAWALYTPGAGMSTIISTLISTPLLLYTAYIHPSPLTRRITLASAILSISLFPMTALLGILDTNSQLMKIDREKIREDQVTRLTKEWEGLHRWRFLSFVGGWGCALAGLVLDGRVVRDY